jgi:hypothetical protein
MYALLVISEHILSQFSSQNKHSADMYNIISGPVSALHTQWLWKSHGVTVADLTKRSGPMESKGRVEKRELEK